MTKTIKAPTAHILVPTIEEVPRISDAERQTLHETLDQARADIAAGNFDVVTSETLQVEFDSIFHNDKTDAELDALAKGSSTSQR